MGTASNNNHRIARNTLILYVRLVFTMAVSFLTTRELLVAIGTVDYGLANVIGGVVAMFSFLSGTIAGAAGRFFNIELGRRDFHRLKEVFNLTRSMYFFLAVLLFILAESVGLWLFHNTLEIQADRMHAAFWFFQFSALAFVFKVLRVPYQALVIARENMKLYAAISLVEALGALLVVHLIMYMGGDGLILYGLLTACLAFGVFVSQWLTCRLLYAESRFMCFWEGKLFKEMALFSSWSLFGAVSVMLNGLGINILLNNYHGAIANAARGVAAQASSGVSSLTQNFLLAAKPQIHKYWAEGNMTEMHSLIYRASKFGFLLILVASGPVIFEVNYVLGIWLEEVPQYAAGFTRWMIIGVLVDTFSYPIMSAVEASGRIARYQLIVGGILCLKFPLAFILLEVGFVPITVFYMTVLISLISLPVRLVLARGLVGLSIKAFLSDVLFPISTVLIVAVIMPVVLMANMEEGFIRFISLTLSWLILSIVAVWFLGMSRLERGGVVAKVKGRLKLLVQ